ncbi:hypothetical protein BGX29_010395 [Mortierella sp. GBA35]|nr:hypothetical protein BGX29_010395 [Mortierella sp. GBA35]
MHWYLKAAAQEYPRAQFGIGSMYYNDEGVSHSFPQALEWYLKAAHGGYAFAQYCVGHMYYYGVGIPKDFPQTMYWCLKAAEGGHVFSYIYWPYIYHRKAVPNDRSKVIEWFQKAVDLGDDDAKDVLEELGELKS